MKKTAVRYIATGGAVAVVVVGAVFGSLALRTALTPESAPEPTSTVAPASFQYETEPEHPTPTPTVAPVVEVPAAPPAEEPTQDDAVVNEDGSVSGTGCPAPYVDLGYGCQDPICGVDENGNDIPCTG